MRFSAQVLTEEDKHRVHKMSLRILEEVGIRFHGDKAAGILMKNGVRINPEDRIAHIPAEIVEHALINAPKSFVLGARNPRYNFPLPAPATRYGIDGTAAFTLDFTTGERRYGTSKDIENAMRIFQQMDMGVMVWAPTCAMDKPAHTRALAEFFSMARYCSKHGEHELHSVEQVPYLEEGLISIMGSEDALRKSNAYSLIYCPVAPLTHDGKMLDAYLELGEVGLPVTVMPMPVAGTTGPASLYSNIAVANAEFLSSLVIFQLAHPGRPLIYASSTAIVDFRSGAYLAGVPEMGLQTAALGEMGRYYGLPVSGAGLTADAKQVGPESMLEKLMTTIPPVLTGMDILIGFGVLESDQLLVLEQIVMDNEIAHVCQRLAEGVDCSADKDFFEDVAKVGPGGHYLGTRNTRKAARSSEFYLSQLFDRHSYESWINLGKPSMAGKAREEVERILSEPLNDPLPEEVCGKLDRILDRAAKEIPER